MGGWVIAFNCKINYLNWFRNELVPVFIGLHPMDFSVHNDIQFQSSCCKICKQAAESSTELLVCEGNGYLKDKCWPTGETAEILNSMLLLVASPSYLQACSPPDLRTVCLDKQQRTERMVRLGSCLFAFLRYFLELWNSVLLSGGCCSQRGRE